MLTGAFVGSEPESYGRADALERWQDDTLDVQNVFVTWDESTDPLHRLFERQLPRMWAQDRVPMVTWEPFTRDPAATPTDVSRRIAAGEFDDYIDRFRRHLESWLAGPDGVLGTDDDRELYVRLGHEPNGDWYPWAPARGTDPADYVEMWRTVHRAVTAHLPADRVHWVWAVNHVDVGDVAAEALYPGEAFVDWVGVDGFNWGASQSWSAWQTPAAVFDDMLDRVAALGDHPVCVPEYASSSATTDGHSVPRKNEWIRAAFEYFRESAVEMAVWFNIEKETDWAVFDAERGDMVVTIDGERYTAYSAYRNAIRTLD